jgi:hypothetical protein
MDESRFRFLKEGRLKQAGQVHSAGLNRRNDERSNLFQLITLQQRLRYLKSASRASTPISIRRRAALWQ